MATYLPPGWTAEQLESATLSDIQQLPPDTLHKLDLNYMSSADNSARDLVLTAQLTESRRLERISLGLPPAPPKTKPERDPYVQIVEDEGFMDFGYLCFRTTYADDARWEKWQENFDAGLEGGLVGCAGRERVAERLMVMFVDDSDLDGVGFSDVAKAFADVKENGDFGPGLDVGMCLMLDEEAMASLLEPVEGKDPWVWAVDVSYDFDGAQMEDGYPGRFKVAIDSLISDLWPLLAGSSMQPESLWQPENSIWKSAI
ncbi:hypothetical protein DL95DRAFT_347250 [Leptodontidium sp. 2 PMI_412]|nr:hypothetical protein DL95DRAFT_347250 [Leptodontidium sp. 2 PMI_412]